MRIALWGSIAVHGALIGALLLAFGEAAPAIAPDTKPVTIEVVDYVESPIPIPVEQPRPGGGGSPAATLVALQPRPPSKRPTLADLATASIETPRRSATEPGRSIEEDGSSRGRGGDGAGGGNGEGIGNGDGDGIAGAAAAIVPPPPAPPSPPPPVAASRAQPAHLVYPRREREVADGALFVARVIVDDEGYVVGAHLVRGFGGPRDAEAAQLIWRFRYEPARDASGRKIRSTFEQRFLVNR